MKINEIIIQKINRGELITAEYLISSLNIRNDKLRIYWQKKYNELSSISIKGVR